MHLKTTIVSVFVFLGVFGLAHAGAEAPEGRAIAIEAPEYDPLIGGNLSGSGFHFEHNGERYIGCSLHQTGGAVPEAMISLDVDGGIKVTERVSRGHDVQIVRYDSPELDEIPALVFDPDAEILIGDPVYLYDGNKASPGFIVRARKNHRRVVRMDKPFHAMGASGSPVVSAVTGTVIGVLLDANDGEAATVVGFELLKME